MSTPAEIAQSIESQLTAPLYGLDPKERHDSLLALLKKELAYACDRNLRFRNYVKHWPVHFHTADTLADLPYLPVGAFKSNPPLALVDTYEVKRTLTSSATTGQVPSRVVLDAETAKRMTKGVTTIIKNFVGPARRPYVVTQGEIQISIWRSFSIAPQSGERPRSSLMDLPTLSGPSLFSLYSARALPSTFPTYACCTAADGNVWSGKRSPKRYSSEGWRQSLAVRPIASSTFTAWSRTSASSIRIVTTATSMCPPLQRSS